MAGCCVTRREFLGASVLGAALSPILADPAQAAAQAAGVKRADLPDLTVKEVKVYVADLGNIVRINTPESGEIVSIVTNSGIEGNFPLGNRGNPPGWLEYAKKACLGRSVIDLLPTITAGRRGRGGFTGGFGGAVSGRGMSSAAPNLHAAAIDVCLWDILGKAVDRPIYRILGGTKTRMLAYASSQHLSYVEDFAEQALKAKSEGFQAYKIHPGGGQRKSGGQIPAYLGHMEEIRQVRKAVGDDYTLLFDPVQRYNRFEALKVGRLLDDQGYVSFEDPIATTDIEGLIELRRALDVPIEVGEFLYSINSFAEYIRRDALDIVRLIADNTGGITGSMRVGQLADSFGMPCTPHNWGNVLDLAVHFQLELALPNSYWFEMPYPQTLSDRIYHKDVFRIDKDGYVSAPTAPGLGYPLDRDALEKIMKRVDR